MTITEKQKDRYLVLIHSEMKHREISTDEIPKIIGKTIYGFAGKISRSTITL